MLQKSLRLIAATSICATLLTSNISWAQTTKFVLGGNVSANDTVKTTVVHFADGTNQRSAAGVVIGTGTSIINNLGGGNSSAAAVSFIGSGQNNVINGSADFGVIVGGKNNTIENQSINYSSSIPAPVNPGSHNFISSGEFNRIKENTNHAAIIGGRNNTIARGASNSVIIGGTNITAIQANTVYMPNVVVSGLAKPADPGYRMVFIDSSGNFKTMPGGGGIPVANCAGLDLLWRTDGQNVVPPGCDVSFGTTAHVPLKFKTHSDLQMIITDDGNVGIGVPAPTYKLEVCGTILSKEWIVKDNGWCDFKFEPDYKRMTWQEKSEYVKQNKHLPEIASASEITNDGLKVSKAMYGFVWNIEDNTMDIIDLQKENETLKKKNDELEKRLVVLEKKINDK